jgi:chromosome segregation ATPase
MPDSKTVSSILVNEVLATAADQLHREKDYISDDIAQNEDETAKLRKIIAKYQDALARQQKEEKNAMDDLMLQ